MGSMSDAGAAVVPVPQVRVDREERARQLLREIREIFVQYQREMPRTRAPWPESIRTRILELWRLGVTSNQIARETALPAQTLYSWRQRMNREKTPAPGFKELPVAIKGKRRRSRFEIKVDDERRRRALQLSQLESRPTRAAHKGPTVTVVTPSGLRLEGVPLEHAARIAREITRP